MLTHHTLKQGFGPKHTKEYFVIQVDGDTMGGVVAGPFESREQCERAIDALRPLYNRRLVCVGGHLTGWRFTKALLDIPEDSQQYRNHDFQKGGPKNQGS